MSLVKYCSKTLGMILWWADHPAHAPAEPLQVPSGAQTREPFAHAAVPQKLLSFLSG